MCYIVLCGAHNVITIVPHREVSMVRLRKRLLGYRGGDTGKIVSVSVEHGVEFIVRMADGRLLYVRGNEIEEVS